MSARIVSRAIKIEADVRLTYDRAGVTSLDRKRKDEALGGRREALSLRAGGLNTFAVAYFNHRRSVGPAGRHPEHRVRMGVRKGEEHWIALHSGRFPHPDRFARLADEAPSAGSVRPAHHGVNGRGITIVSKILNRGRYGCIIGKGDRLDARAELP